MEDVQVRNLIDQQLDKRYIVIAKRDLVPYSIAVACILTVLGVGTWQLAQRTAHAVATDVAGSTAAASAQAEIERLRVQGELDARALAEYRQQWETGGPSELIDSRIMPLAIGLENLYSHTGHRDKMALVHWVMPAYNYYNEKYDMRSDGPQAFPKSFAVRTP